MDYTGPVSLVDLDADPALGEEEMREEDWPLLPPQAGGQSRGLAAPRPHTSSKRPMDSTSDTDSEPLSPAAKSTRRKGSSPPCETRDVAPDNQLLPLSCHDISHRPTAVRNQPFPAFASRAKYVKLVFRDNPGVDIKLRWLAEVNRAFSLDRNLAEVKLPAVTSRFVYVSRKREDLIDSMTRGEFLALQLDKQDSLERPRKYSTFLLTRYPVSVDPSKAKELPGVYSARRFHQNGVPINRLVFTWSLPEAPPPTVTFSFLPCLPSCAHDSRTCIHRTPPSAAASTSCQDPPPKTDAKWKCPRCHLPGVNVWHGCARRSIIHRNPASAASHIPTHVSLPPPAPSCPTVSNPGPTQVSSLQKAVDSLNSQCASLAARLNTTEARFDAIESRFGILAASLADLSTKLATNDTTLKSLIEAQQVIITSVTSLTDKLDSLATRFETVTTPTVEVSRGSPRNNNLPTPPTSSGSRRMNIDALPSPMDHSIIYMGDFNARHPALGGRSNTVNYSGTQVTKFIQHNHLTRWDTGASQVKCSSVPALFSDHPLSLQYSIPVHLSAHLYQYPSKTRAAHEWTLDRRIKAAERQAVEDSLVYQRDPTPDNLKQYQTSSSALVALQQCSS
ncbi:hypothetical protein C7M84_002030 [Penaeus vannamei]|uniref:Endonuclease/exonuclease/phosphatase domain-containing protein n=1 Tax=Penaeus vannamei TaxID=6689 RepID=A0A423TS12_PENVA|nr:hypothetical protein C7M84_002030 [Penaeus vannamei]